MPTSRKNNPAKAIELILAEALGPSGILELSTPASFNFLAEFKTLEESHPFGGRSSTLTTNFLLESFFARSLFCADGTGATVLAVSCFADSVISIREGESAFTAELINLVCSAVVPQHPPTMRTPLRINRFA